MNTQRRTPVETVANLEEKENEEYVAFSDVINASHSQLDLAEIRLFSKELKRAYLNLLETMTKLCARYEKMGSYAEAALMKNRKSNVVQLFNDKYSDIRKRRVELDDDDLSTAPPSNLSPENLSQIGSETHSEKIRRYFGENPLSEIGDNEIREEAEASGASRTPTPEPLLTNGVLPKGAVAPSTSMTATSVPLRILPPIGAIPRSLPNLISPQEHLPGHKSKTTAQDGYLDFASKPPAANALPNHEAYKGLTTITTTKVTPSSHHPQVTFQLHNGRPPPPTSSTSPSGAYGPTLSQKPYAAAGYRTLPPEPLVPPKFSTETLPLPNQTSPFFVHTPIGTNPPDFHGTHNPPPHTAYTEYSQRDHPPGNWNQNQSSGVSPGTPQNPFLQFVHTSPTNDGVFTPSNLLLRRELLKGCSDPFDGDAAKFESWHSRLCRRLEGAKLRPLDIIDILAESTKGAAKSIVEDYLQAAPRDPVRALNQIWSDFCRLFGSSTKVFNQLKKQISNFTPVKSHLELGRLRDLLRLVKAILLYVGTDPEFEIFNLNIGMNMVVNLMPMRLKEDWQRDRFSRERQGVNSSLYHLARLLEDHLWMISSVDLGETRKNITALCTVPEKTDSSEVSLTTDTNPRGKSETRISCHYHKDNSHKMNRCPDFISFPVGKREKLVKEWRLCFNCLGSHRKDQCSSKFLCKFCNSRHHSLLHKDFNSNANGTNKGPNPKPPSRTPQRFPPGTNQREGSHSALKTCALPDEMDGASEAGTNEDASSNAEPSPPEEKPSHLSLVGTTENKVSSTTSKVLLVDIMPTTSQGIESFSGTPKRCYAIIDEQSSTSFISPELAASLRFKGPKIDYNLSTMSGLSTATQGDLISGLSVRGVGEKLTHNLPPVLTNPFIPNAVNEVASPEMVKANPLIKKYHKFFNPVDHSKSVMLLIGRDCGDLMATKCFGNVAPFVHKTKLGYAAVGLVQSKNPLRPGHHLKNFPGCP